MLTANEVQDKLNMIDYGQEFTVVFTKKDGTQRKITGYMEKPTSEPRYGRTDLGKQSVAVPVVTEEGWKSFRLDSVLSIEVGLT
jgi:hypothetical protein